MGKGTVVIGTIGSDCHTVGSWIIARSLEAEGFKVVRLGSCVLQKEFIEASVETNADAIVVSSMYGLGFFDCQGFKDKCIEAGLQDIILYIGGYLTTVKDESWSEVEKRFKEIGFDRVYSPDTEPLQAVEDLDRDIQQRRRGRI